MTQTHGTNGSAQMDRKSPPDPLEPSARQTTQSPIDDSALREYAAVLWRRKWLAAAFLAMSCLAAAGWTYRQTPIFQATASVQIDVQAPQVLGQEVSGVSDLGVGSYWSNLEYYQTQYEVIRSQSVAEGVVRELGLQRDPRFISVSGHSKGVSVEEAAIQLRQRITVDPVKDSRIVRVSVRDPDPRLAQLLANAVADTYVDQNLEKHLRSTVSALEWLSGQLQNLRAQLETSELALHEFKQTNNIPSISLADRQNTISQQMEQLTQKLTDVRSRRIELGAKLRSYRGVVATDPLTIPTTSPGDTSLMQRLKEQVVEVTRGREDLAKRYGAEHPRMQAIEAQRETVTAQLAREVQAVLRGLEAEHQAARSSEGEIAAELARINQEALDLNRQEMQFNRLARERENNEKLYGLLLTRTSETDLTRLLRVNNLSVLDRALLPRAPVSPDMKVSLVLGLAIGLLGGVLFAFFYEYMDSSLKTREEVERTLGVPLLGVVPLIPLDAQGNGRSRKRKKGQGERAANAIYLHEHPRSSVAECARAIRTNLLFLNPDNPPRQILVTSTAPQEGKTMTTVNLGIVLAQGGARVLIVDTDMRRPRVHRAFGISNDAGLSSVLLGEQSIPDVLRETQIPGLWIVPCGPTPSNPAEIFHTEKFASIVADLRSRFDWVLLDSPPLMVVTDAAVLSSIVDGVVFVVKAGQTPRDLARQARRVLADVNAKILGVILNGIDLERGRYGYSYYHYHRRYGSYYADQVVEDKAAGLEGGA